MTGKLDTLMFSAWGRSSCRLVYDETPKLGKGPAACQETILAHGDLLGRLYKVQENLSFKKSQVEKAFLG